MDMAAILFIWPEPFEQTSIPPSHGGSLWNLASTGPVVSEEDVFKVSVWQTDGRRRPIYPVNSPMSLRLRWANDTCNINNTLSAHTMLFHPARRSRSSSSFCLKCPFWITWLRECLSKHSVSMRIATVCSFCIETIKTVLNQPENSMCTSSKPSESFLFPVKEVIMLWKCIQPVCYDSFQCFAESAC